MRYPRDIRKAQDARAAAAPPEDVEVARAFGWTGPTTDPELEKLRDETAAQRERFEAEQDELAAERAACGTCHRNLPVTEPNTALGTCAECWERIYGQPLPKPRGGRRAGAGRPAALPGNPRHVRSGVSCTDGEWAQVLDYAKRSGLKPARAVWDLMRKGLEVVQAPERYVEQITARSLAAKVARDKRYAANQRRAQAVQKKIREVGLAEPEPRE